MLFVCKELIILYVVCVQRVDYLGAFAKLREATVSFVLSVRPSAWSNSAITGGIFMKFDIFIFENFSKICRENSNLIKT
jgi:hypothetical protein